MRYKDDLFHLLSEISKDQGYNILGLSNNYIMEITNNLGKKIYIYGNSLPLNNNASQKICSDKSATSTVLKNNNIPCVEHFLFKHPDYEIDWKNKDLKNFLKAHPQGIVVKDNHGSCGRFVFLVKNNQQLLKAKKELVKQKKDIALSPYINFQNEYRLIMLDNECKLCYKKIRPFIIGNGKDNIKRLVKQKYGSLNFKISLLKQLKVLKSKERLTIGWKHNLNMNSSPEIVKNKKTLKLLTEIAEKATKLLNLRFCSVDLIEDNNQIKVLEINSIVSMKAFKDFSKTNYLITKNIFSQALNKAFEN